MSSFRDEFSISPTGTSFQETSPLTDPGSFYPMTLPIAPGQTSLPPPTTTPLAFSEPGPSNSTSVALSVSPEEPLQAKKKFNQKSRRKRQHIQLSPDQPLTVKGTQRTRVYTACRPCRSRKTRCDGARPTCRNCINRASGDPCSYDETPNRRGPDKDPGARQRAKVLGLSSEPRRRRRATSESGMTDDGVAREATAQDLASHSNQSGSASRHLDDAFDLSTHTHAPSPIGGYDNSVRLVAQGLQANPSPPSPTQPLGYGGRNSPPDPYMYISPPTYASTQQNQSETYYDTSPTIVPGPSLSYTRQTWWDSALTLYAMSGDSFESTPLTLTHTQREAASNHILFDIKFLFRMAPYWFCFFNVPRFFSHFSDHTRRLELQPGYILAMLALSTFLQSSESGLGVEGRNKALRLLDEAQGALDASLNAGRLDHDLAKAAWLIAFFEVCAHPQHSSQRVTSSMMMLDSLVRYMNLMTIDADDARAIRWPEGVPPIVPRHRKTPPALQAAPRADACNCRDQTLGHHWPLAANTVPTWISTPAWPDGLPESELQREECRRLIWSSVQLLAGYNSYAVARGTQAVDFALCNASNYAFLFPGEVTVGSCARDAVWNIYFRAIMLWNGCIWMRGEANISDPVKAKYAMAVWMESCELDDLLDKHTCDTERSFLFIGREFLYNVRMYISQESRQIISLVQTDLINRRKAEEWLSHQAVVMNHLMEGLPKVTGHSNGSLMYRPFFIFWLMGQLFRALTSWSLDNSLLVALNVGKAITTPIEYLMSLFPCDAQRAIYQSLREQLVSACISARIPPPPPPKINLGTMPTFVGTSEHLEVYHNLPQHHG